MAYRVNGGRQWQDEWEEADPWLRTPEPENPKAAPPGLPAPPPALATVGAPAFYLPDWARQMGEDITAWLAPEVDMFGADRNGRGFMQALEPFASIQVGNGDSQSETPVDWQGLAAYLSGKRVYQAADKNTWWRWLQDTDGNIISSPEFLTYDGDRAFGIAAALAGGLVAGNVGGAFSGASSAADSMTAYLTTGAVEGSTFGGALAGGGASGAVGSGSLAAALQGTQAALINAAQQGTVSGVLTEARGGDFADGFVSGFGAGAVGQGVGLLGIPEAVGVTWQPAAGVINSGLSGGVLAEVNGGRFNDGFEAGAVGAAITQALQGVIAAVSSWTEPAAPIVEKPFVPLEPYFPSVLDVDAAPVAAPLFDVSFNAAPLQEPFTGAGLVELVQSMPAYVEAPAWSSGPLLDFAPSIWAAPVAAPVADRPRPPRVGARDVQTLARLVGALLGGGVGGGVGGGGGAAATRPGAAPRAAEAAPPAPLFVVAAAALAAFALT